MKNSDVTVKFYLKKHIAQKHTLKMTTLALVGGTVAPSAEKANTGVKPVCSVGEER